MNEYYSIVKSVCKLLLSCAVFAIVGCQSSTSFPAAAIEDAASAGSPLLSKAAPAFTLLDHTGNPWKLAHEPGVWLVLFFYPQDDTPGCTCEATEFTALMKRFSNSGAKVVGVSPDSVDSHRRFHQRHGLNLTLLSDPDNEVAKLYGAWRSLGAKDGSVGRIVRSTVLIAPSGRIAHHYPEVIPEGHASRVLARLIAIQND